VNGIDYLLNAELLTHDKTLQSVLVSELAGRRARPDT